MGDHRMTLTVSDKLMFLSAGIGIGAVVGLLFAPRSGQEIRGTLANKVHDTSSGIGEVATQKLHDVVEKGKNIASIGRQRFNESVEAGKQRFGGETIEGEDLLSRR
jgi:gas vesicle protein